MGVLSDILMDIAVYKDYSERHFKTLVLLNSFKKLVDIMLELSEQDHSVLSVIKRRDVGAMSYVNTVGFHVHATIRSVVVLDFEFECEPKMFKCRWFCETKLLFDSFIGRQSMNIAIKLYEVDRCKGYYYFLDALYDNLIMAIGLP